MEKVQAFYKEALKIEKNSESKFLIDMYQRYSIELAVFYMTRQEDHINAFEWIKKALSIKEDGMFYNDTLLLTKSILVK